MMTATVVESRQSTGNAADKRARRSHAEVGALAFLILLSACGQTAPPQLTTQPVRPVIQPQTSKEAKPTAATADPEPGPAGPSYASLATSDFFKFFHVTETGREARDGATLVHWKTGGFRDQIVIELLLASDGHVTEASLILLGKWIGDERHINPFANDISKSFLMLFRSPIDQEQMNYFTEALWGQHGSQDEVIKLHPDDERPGVVPPDVQAALAVYLGRSKRFTIQMRATDLSFERVRADSLGGGEAVRIHVIFRAMTTADMQALETPTQRSRDPGDLRARIILPEVLTGQPFLALLNRDLATPKDVAAAKGKAQILPPGTLISIIGLLKANEPKTYVTADLFDGVSGHTINLLDITDDLSAFEYWEPWEPGSFLEAVNNAAGVTARLVRPRVWRVSIEELKLVLYDVIVSEKDLTALIDLAKRFVEDEAGLSRDYRKLPGDSPVISERRLGRLARVFASAGNSPAALALGRLNADMHPMSTEASAILARVHDAAKNTAAAMQAWREAARRLPGDTRLSQGQREELQNEIDRHLSSATNR